MISDYHKFCFMSKKSFCLCQKRLISFSSILRIKKRKEVLIQFLTSLNNLRGVVLFQQYKAILHSSEDQSPASVHPLSSAACTGISTSADVHVTLMVHEGPHNFSGLRRGLSLQKFYVLIMTNPLGIKYEPRSQCCCLLITGKIPVKKDLELQIIFRIFIYNAGGGWTLVVSISSTNNQHLQRAVVNCFDLELCVPFDKQSMTT